MSQYFLEKDRGKYACPNMMTAGIIEYCLGAECAHWCPARINTGEYPIDAHYHDKDTPYGRCGLSS